MQAQRSMKLGDKYDAAVLKAQQLEALCRGLGGLFTEKVIGYRRQETIGYLLDLATEIAAEVSLEFERCEMDLSSLVGEPKDRDSKKGNTAQAWIGISGILFAGGTYWHESFRQMIGSKVDIFWTDGQWDSLLASVEQGFVSARRVDVPELPTVQEASTAAPVAGGAK